MIEISQMARTKLVLHLYCAMPIPRRASGVCKPGSTEPATMVARLFFALDDDGLLPDGPDNDEQFFNSWQVISESVSKARFDVGRPEKMWAAPRV